MKRDKKREGGKKEKNREREKNRIFPITCVHKRIPIS
jgi:hypothetical protein